MSGPLRGLRVLDLGQYVAGPLVAMMLADAGADVVRVDPPGGPVWRHPGNAVLQRGKRSAVFDLHHAGDREAVLRLARTADVLVENFRPGVMERLGLGYDDLRAGNPGLVHCALPGFGSDDPRAGLQGWEGVVEAAAGAYAPTWLNPGAEPAFSALTVSSNFAAFIGANCVLAALVARQRWGFGQRVEVPLYDATFEAIGMLGQELQQEQRLPMHAASNADYPCADGQWVRLVLLAPRHLQWLVERFLPPEVREPGMADNAVLAARPDLAGRLRQRIAEMMLTRPAADWDRDINAAGIPIAVHHSSRHWLRGDEQAKAVGAVLPLRDPEHGDTVQAGFPVSMSVTPPEVRGPRRQLGADTSAVQAGWSSPPAAVSRVTGLPAGDPATGALSGIRVVDLTQVWAGPTAGRILGELGADVVKVNSPANGVLGHLLVNSGKRTALVDLAAPEGRGVVLRLAATADVFLQNFSADTAGRLGIGEPAVRQARADVVYASLSCYGYRGPRGAQRGWEPLGQTPTGLMLRAGGDAPRCSSFAVCDYGSGHLLAFGILLGLYHRLRTGVGQHVQSSLVQAGTYHQVPWLVDFPGRAWDEPSGRAAAGWGPLDRMYAAADRSFYLAVDKGDLRRLAGVEGLDGLDRVPADAVQQVLAQRFAGDTARTWVERLTARGVAAQVCHDVAEVMADPLSRQRGLSVVREHPGVGPVRSIGPGPRMSVTAVRAGRPVGLPGADTRAVLAELGLADRYGTLVGAGVVADRLAPDTPLML